MFPNSESASITKKELFSIIEDQNEAIEILKREVKALKRGEGAVHNPASRKRERTAEMENESSPSRRPISMWRPNDQGSSDFEGCNVGMLRRLSHHCSVRKPLARNVLTESVGTNIPPLPNYDGTTDPEDHLNGYFTKIQLYNSSDATLCKVFPSTFAGVVLNWYHQCFEQFAAMFLQNLPAERAAP
ncbi:unnamed protein product [Linum trigynum]|uniref:Uncharacterized protein n=1 Tax=Linum trigynum TaxID=586398 RepID=A0AAV2G088_9ROSI